MISGLMTSAINNIVPTKSSSKRPYWVKMDKPLPDTLVYTRPMMPKGARLMTQRTMLLTASAVSAKKALVVSPASCFMARPNRHAHSKMPM